MIWFYVALYVAVGLLCDSTRVAYLYLSLPYDFREKFYANYSAQQRLGMTLNSLLSAMLYGVPRLLFFLLARPLMWLGIGLGMVGGFCYDLSAVSGHVHLIRCGRHADPEVEHG